MLKTIFALVVTTSSLAGCVQNKAEEVNPYTFQRTDLASHVNFATLHVKVPYSLLKDILEKNSPMGFDNSLNDTYSYPVTTRILLVNKTDEIYPVFRYHHTHNKLDYDAMLPLTRTYTAFDPSYRAILEQYEKSYQMLVDNVHENKDWQAYRYNEKDWLVLDKNCHIFATIAQGTYHEVSTSANHANRRFEENCLSKQL